MSVSIPRRISHRHIFAPAMMLVMLAGARITFAQGTPNILWQKDLHDDQVLEVAFSSDGRHLASGADYWDATAKIWNAADGTLLQTLPKHGDGAVSVEFAPGGAMLAVGYLVSGYPPGGLTNVWNLETTSVVHNFGGFYTAYSSDGLLLATAGPWRDIYVHQLPGGEEIADIYTGDYVLDVAFSPTEPIVASAGADNKVKLWNAVTGEWIRTLSGHMDNVSTIDFSPDGTLIASGAGGFDDTQDASIKIWRVADGQLLRTLAGHDDWTYDVEFSPDGSTLISTGRDGYPPNLKNKIKMWRVADGELLRYYDQNVKGSTVTFSPNGKFFAYGLIDGTVVVAHNPFAPIADVNGDGVVDIDDVFAILSAWGTCDACPEDLNNDGKVDIDDLFEVLANWT